jgi:hypothetical protein
MIIQKAIQEAFNKNANQTCEDNVFIPLQTRLQDYEHYWESFNVDLYRRICQIKKYRND